MFLGDAGGHSARPSVAHPRNNEEGCIRVREKRGETWDVCGEPTPEEILTRPGYATMLCRCGGYGNEQHRAAVRASFASSGSARVEGVIRPRGVSVGRRFAMRRHGDGTVGGTIRGAQSVPTRNLSRSYNTAWSRGVFALKPQAACIGTFVGDFVWRTMASARRFHCRPFALIFSYSGKR